GIDYYDVRYDIIAQGITDPKVALKMQTDYINSQTLITSDTSTPPDPTPTPTQDISSGPTPTPTPVSLITACTSSTSCSTTIGM
ncbi:MAG: hypothetical protein ACXVCD_18380, partial [Pseudobdellovibrionaceae bacterium]